MIKRASLGFLLLAGCATNPLVGIQAVHDVNPNEAVGLIDNPQIKVVDVRTPGEYAQGHLKGALLLPTGEINEKVAMVLPDKNQAILVTCGSGMRSRAASALLNRLGYTRVFNLTGGLRQWPYELEGQ